ncbi:MAG: hypothetical protein NT172_07500 [Planctomycetota bacterium]|nr:hypothetical protein [Planctomycetota bacterium]
MLLRPSGVVPEFMARVGEPSTWMSLLSEIEELGKPKNDKFQLGPAGKS